MGPGKSNRYNEANALLGQDSYERALELYDLTLASDPSHERAWINRGIALSQLGRERESADSYLRAIELNRDRLLTHYNYVLALGKLRDRTAALAHARELVRLHPDRAFAVLALAAAQERSDMSQDALVSYQRAVTMVESHPHSYRVDQASPTALRAAIHLGQARALARLGRGAAARSSLQRAPITHGFSRWYTLALIDFHDGRPEMAAARLQDAIKSSAPGVHSEMQDVLFLLGESCIASEDFPCAIDALTEYLVESPHDAIAHYNLGYAYALDGNPVAADGWFTSALEIDENLIEARVERAALRMNQGHFREALSDLDRIWKTSKDNPRVAEMRAYALLGVGECAPALDWARSRPARSGNGEAVRAVLRACAD